MPPQPIIRAHRGDLPADYRPGSAIAIDTETLGLNPHRDRLCVVQISRGDGEADGGVDEQRAAGAHHRTPLSACPIRSSATGATTV